MQGLGLFGELLLYLCIVIAGILAGAILTGLVGLLLGILLASGYTKRDPSDPGDAPVYVALALIFFGAIIGAVIGAILSLVSCVFLAYRKRSSSSALNEAATQV